MLAKQFLEVVLKASLSRIRSTGQVVNPAEVETSDLSAWWIKRHIAARVSLPHIVNESFNRDPLLLGSRRNREVELHLLIRGPITRGQ